MVFDGWLVARFGGGCWCSLHQRHVDIEQAQYGEYALQVCCRRIGFYGAEPSLTDLNNGDLKASTDFRAVYGELISKVLAADPQQVLGVHLDPLGFLA